MTEQDDQQAKQGYLLLADISGYTSFLTGTELEHSHAIIRELTKLIRERLAPPMRFVKLEGDAVFCYAAAATFADAERFVELIEVCYFDFSNRLLDMTRATTCRCDACKAIPTLGLKFVTHFGTFMVERDDGREDLAGPDVILGPPPAEEHDRRRRWPAGVRILLRGLHGTHAAFFQPATTQRSV